MKLTIEKDRERLKRFSHIQRAPPWMGSRCERRCPGSRRECSRKKGHPGPHVAHGILGRVLAVWDEGARIGAAPKTSGAGKVPGKKAGTLKEWLGSLPARVPSIEDSFLLLLALAMAGFAVDWALRILGLK